MGGRGVMLSDEIADSWLDAAIRHAQMQGYTFEPACQADLEDFLRNAATQLRASEREATAKSHISEVQHLVQYMIEESIAVSPRARELHEWTFAHARTRFCPLFPFC
jgi:hypothetical protein